jgi:uncharacterized protein
VAECEEYMKRQCSLDEISDGKLYSANDLVEASCNGCHGKASCCHGMGNSIILDPYDTYRLTTGLNVSFEQLLAGKLELNVVDGIILPNLKMIGAKEQCSFLDERGKCSIHNFRSGICRIFPLGRVYENNSFQYFLQTGECRNSSKTQVKISKWIATEDLERNEKFLISWHYFINTAETAVKKAGDEKRIKEINMLILNLFYLMKYEKALDFYQQFEARLSKAKELLGI